MSQKQPPLLRPGHLGSGDPAKSEVAGASSPATSGWTQVSLFNTGSRNAFHITCEVSKPAAVTTAHLSLSLLFGGDFWLPCCLSFLVPPLLGLVEGGRWA